MAEGCSRRPGRFRLLSAASTGSNHPGCLSAGGGCACFDPFHCAPAGKNNAAPGRKSKEHAFGYRDI
ncbi:hypothetical protein AMC87_CH01838 [Rhizobium phaseoli]|nr:hypothetical protein AMC87_CH01838 [Rhizobium phaseoli]EGE60075.1 hypothetical protein RHECNPAF_1740091 [Rhizobium etli CNPAF512]